VQSRQYDVPVEDSTGSPWIWTDATGVRCVVFEGDRWIQDEIEFGQCDTLLRSMPVVIDGPRNRELDNFSEQSLLGPDFGQLEIPSASRSSLDSFGNLEVCPPTPGYPLGRIVYGGPLSESTDPLGSPPSNGADGPSGARFMSRSTVAFLEAQRVQAPFSIYSDWLDVGHVDEFISFVSHDSPAGFRILIASPREMRRLLRRWILAGAPLSDEPLFDGEPRAVIMDDAASAQVFTPRTLDGESRLWSATTAGPTPLHGNDHFQAILDAVRTRLKTQLNIDDSYFIEIPVMFHAIAPSVRRQKRTAAFFPDMVNHLVLGEHSLVPKPHGPRATPAGPDLLEQAFRDAVPWRTVHFVEDWWTYHEELGEVHCGTNTLRKSYASQGVLWWKRTMIHTVASGDTLRTIAARYLGSVSQWRVLYDMNRAVIGADPNLIRVGQKLTIPFEAP
jgi:protein-arginine deiminase